MFYVSRLASLSFVRKRGESFLIGTILLLTGFAPLAFNRTDTSFTQHTLHHRAAVEWIESYLADPTNKPAATQERQQESSNRDKLKRMQSNLSGSTLTIWRRMGSFFGDDDDAEEDPRRGGGGGGGGGGGCVPWRYLTVFTAGMSMGVIVASRMSSSARRI